VRLAATQHAVVARAQLRELGFTGEMVRRRVEAGRLYRAQPDVYSLLPSLKTPGRMMAAVLSCGPDAALSHRAAAAVWELRPWPTGAIDVSVTRNRAPRTGVRIHRVERVEAVTHAGFPVTRPMRTLSDLVAAEPPPRVERAYEQADRLGLLDVAELEAECEARRGSRILKRLIAEGREAPATKNELERALRVLRFTWHQLTRQPGLVAEAIGSSSTTPSRGSSAGGSSPPRSVPAISSSGDFSFGMKPDFMPK
jgi:hypothetical protein